MFRPAHQGFALAGFLIGAGLLGVALLGLNQVLGLSLGFQKRVELRDELVSIRRSVRDQLDCAATLSGNLPCDPARYFDLKRSDGSSLLSPTRRLASYELRAFCDGQGLHIERNCPSTAGSLPGPPLCSGWGPLYPEGDVSCAGAFQVCDPACDPSATYCSCPMDDEGDFVLVAADLYRADPNEPGIRTSQVSQEFIYCIAGSFATDTLYPGSSYRVPSGLHWTTAGPIRCPKDYVAVGGGADCQVQPHGGVTLTTTPFADPLTKKPVGWGVDCCVFDGYQPRSPGAAPVGTVSPQKGHAYVICRKE